MDLNIEDARALAQFRAEHPTYVDGVSRLPGSWRFYRPLTKRMTAAAAAIITIPPQPAGESTEPFEPLPVPRGPIGRPRRAKATRRARNRSERDPEAEYYADLRAEVEAGIHKVDDPRLRVGGKKMLGVSVGMFDQAEEEYQAAKVKRRGVNHDWSGKTAPAADVPATEEIFDPDF